MKSHIRFVCFCLIAFSGLSFSTSAHAKITVVTYRLLSFLFTKAISAQNFAEKAHPNLIADAAKGSGEFLDAYATLNGCKDEKSISAFATTAQDTLAKADPITLSTPSAFHTAITQAAMSAGICSKI